MIEPSDDPSDHSGAERAHAKPQAPEPEIASHSPGDRDKIGLMSHVIEPLVLDRMLDPLGRCLDAESARRILELEVDPLVQARVDELAERANEGLLSPQERAEYEAYINADDFIAVLKQKAKDRLGSNSP